MIRPLDDGHVGRARIGRLDPLGGHDDFFGLCLRGPVRGRQERER